MKALTSAGGAAHVGRDERNRVSSSWLPHHGSLVSIGRARGWASNRVKKIFETTTGPARVQVRRAAFEQQDGLALLPILGAFQRRGVFDRLRKGAVPLGELAAEKAARLGYLAIAIRALAARGWLDGWSPIRGDGALAPGPAIGLSELGRRAVDQLETLGPWLDRLEPALTWGERLDAHLFEGRAHTEGAPSVERLVAGIEDRWGLDPRKDEARLAVMLDGVVAAPLAVALGRRGVFGVQGRGRDTCVAVRPQAPDSVRGGRWREDVATELGRALHWIQSDGSFTDHGRLVGFYASAYAVTTSYLPLLRRAEELIFRGGDFDEIFPRTIEGDETHVDRPMNVWGSGGAHDLYFRTVDEVLVGLFSRPDHPAAICDTGCGDGSYLRHSYEVLRDRLNWNFFENPVYFIGADLNRQSREITRETLARAGVPNAFVVDRGIDIGEPAQLADGIRDLKLRTAGGQPVEATDALHTNSMLVHNRVYRRAAGRASLPSLGDGAFVRADGFAIPLDELKGELVAFMKRWAPLVRRHGWLFIELHTLDTKTQASDPGRTPTMAYDLTHGFSSQYTVERAELLDAARQAGLVPGPESFNRCFPDADKPRISINYLIGG